MKNVQIPQWLEGLPLAPEFRPTDTEFADPIAYINKIEKDASAFGICKVIPPLPKPSRKYVFHNVNKSLSKCRELGSKHDESDSDAGTSIGGEMKAVFTTRHQELGSEKGKKLKGAVGNRFYGARKQVWQSGEVYTLEKFEAKSKCFAKSQLGMLKEVNPFVIESMFWKAASEKPIYVEYANDVPGSGFGEPEGSQRYFDRRRRKRKRSSFDRNSIENSDHQNNPVDTLNKVRDSTNSGNQDNLNCCIETEADPICSGQSHYATSFSGQKEFQGSTEVEGTAGWRLSNSPWNLQVISRSAGSLTRFMPDDIPGVTSPMVYIGMLFSWFAWHVEDHELHSLNYLHIGAPKTWYAVPGCYALKFEEAIRLNAYEGNPDRLVALSLLGEKTTVLSPEIILSSGIPCCRLVQNPGEFVVTFPRAYHIGFSHGFNCGEAANFGTPQWLTVAKEAAVRRAAMNYLPMLSHQQLLYLLTMSFISRIPRSLLPGARSSRFRDRQKEERELLVKRVFVEDILQENILLRILLQRNHLYHLVLWDAESLPSSKESKLCKDVESAGKDCLPNNDHVHDLSELNDYINAVGFDLNCDDMAYDFQVESGALPCVACGVLGFPFMAILQPSEIASHSLLLPDPHAVSVGDSCIRGGASLVPGTSQFMHTVLEQTPVLGHEDVSSKCEATNGWNISNAFLKPRIFCLEHAIEVEGLLSSKGGANVLVICHSDFEKIKNHVADVAEEVHTPFRFTEMPLGNASSENFNLIDIAIGTEEHDCAVDWTSKLSINLQHHMKFKSDRSENSQHLLSLGWLFSDETPVSKASSVMWQSRKFRTKRQHRSQLGSKSSVGGEAVEDMKANEKHPKDNNDLKIIQYSRKKFKGRVSTVNQVTVDAK